MIFFILRTDFFLLIILNRLFYIVKLEVRGEINLTSNKRKDKTKWAKNDTGKKEEGLHHHSNTEHFHLTYYFLLTKI